MTTQIFIEDQEIDVSDEIQYQITYSIDDISKLDTKTTSYSKTIVLKGTSTNNKIFGNIFEVNNNNFIRTGASIRIPNAGYNFNASRSAKVRIDVDGITIIKGTLRLLEIVVDDTSIEYEVAVFGELGGFFTQLGAKKLEDLDFSSYNHVYNTNNITGSWDRDASGMGYYYPLIDYGNVSPASDTYFAKKSFYYTAFRPAFFVKEYMDKIIKGTGYTYESNFFNTDFFKRLIIPNNQQRLAHRKNIVFTAGSTDNDVTANTNVLLNNEVLGFFTTSDHEVFTYGGQQTITNVSFQITLTGQFYVGIPYGQFMNTASVKFEIWKNGAFALGANTGLFGFGANPTSVGGTSSQYAYGWANFTWTATFGGYASYFFNSLGFTIQNGDTWSLRCVPEVGSGVSVRITSANIVLQGNPTMTPTLYGETISVNDTIPKGIFQKDFFSSICKMFYLMITEDKTKERHLKIEPFVDFYNTNPTSYIDWTDKVDRSKPYKIKPMSEINARYYTLKYKQDGDFLNDKYKKKWNETYGEYMYDNKQEFAKDNDGVEVLFASTPLIGYSGDGHDKIFPAIYKVNNGVEEMTEFIPRIMVARKVVGVTNWTIYSSNTDVNGNPVPYISTNAYGYAGHFDNPTAPNYDLNFGATKELFFNAPQGFNTIGLSVNLFNTFYSTYFAENTDKDSRMVTYEMKFNPKDIYNLDFGKFILIDGVLYRLDKIIDYLDNETCKVQFLRVIYNNYY